MSTLSWNTRSGNFLSTIILLAVSLLLIAAARPQLRKGSIRFQASGIDIVLAFDVSGSMQAEDMIVGGKQVSRIEAAKKIAKQFITKRPSDRIGIIAFAGRPYLISPPTLDHDWLVDSLNRMRVGMIEDRTAIGSAIAASVRRLKNCSSKSKIVVLLTDGVNNSGRISPLTAAEAARALRIKVYTIGIGSSGPSPYPITDIFGGILHRMIEFSSDLQTLRSIAKATSGQFFLAEDSQSLTQIFREINRMEKSGLVMNKTFFYRDLFPWIVGIAGSLLLMEILLSQTVWRRLP